MYNYFVFGGVRRDIDYLEDVEEILNILPEKLKDYEKLITENPIFIRRTVEKGVLDIQTALDYAITGVNLRASGICMDNRLQDDLYRGFDIGVVVKDEKDAMARYKARIDEITESIKSSNSDTIYVLATYTAMINYRKYLYSKGYIKKLW